MKKFLTAIALISLLTIPALESANAALVSPSSPAPGTTATEQVRDQASVSACQLNMLPPRRPSASETAAYQGRI